MRERGGRGEKRVSKMALHNAGRVEEVAMIYRKVAPVLVSKLQEATEPTVQQVYTEVTNALAEPWLTHTNRWRGYGLGIGRVNWNTSGRGGKDRTIHGVGMGA